MLKVTGYGNTIKVANPARPGETTEMVNVILQEEGRRGLGSISGSSNVLDQITGAKTGLDGVRTHTQPVLREQLGHFPIGGTLQGHINRELYSFPTIKQHEGRSARMIDGKPTFVTTSLGLQMVEDKDERISNDKLVISHPWLFNTATLGQADVEVLATAAETMAAVGNSAMQTSKLAQ